MTMYTHVQRREFQRIFGRNIREFWDNFTGFDVIKFDDFIQPDDENGESTAEKVRKDYGDEGVNLVTALIDRLTCAY